MTLLEASAPGPNGPPPSATHAAIPKVEPRSAGSDSLLILKLAAESLHDAEQARIAAANRLDALGELFSDDLTRPSMPHPTVLRFASALDDLRAIEHAYELEVKRALREHPLGPWVKRTVGIGEKQGARLLAAIGDPLWNEMEDRPRRGPAELWAYCGYAPEQKRRKGVKNNWNSAAKTRAHLVAKSCIKSMNSPYRPVYDASRALDAGNPDVRSVDGVSAHAHNRALRKVAKAVLRDLFNEARRLS